MTSQPAASVQLTKCSPRTTTTVVAHFSGAPEVKGSYVNAAIVPYCAVLTYEHRTSKDLDGWINHSWFCSAATLTGFRVLKPGANGETRVSDKVTHEARWSSYRDDLTVSERNNLPAFLAAMIEGLRPSGDVSTFTL